MSVSSIGKIPTQSLGVQPEDLLLANLTVTKKVQRVPATADEQYEWNTRGNSFFRWCMALIFVAAVAVVVVAAITASKLQSDPSFSSTAVMQSAKTNAEVLALLGGLIAIFSGVMLVADFYQKKGTK